MSACTFANAFGGPFTRSSISVPHALFEILATPGEDHLRFVLRCVCECDRKREALWSETIGAVSDVIISCPTWGRFRVSRSAIQQLSDMPEALATDALAKAKKRAEIDGGEVPLIRSFDLVLS